MGIADRYVFGEAFVTYMVGLALFLAFLIVNQLFLEWESYSGALENFKLIFILVGYRIPSYLTLSFPIALLFATLMSMGRFAKDNELTAMFTNGISLYRLMLPFMLLVIPNVLLSFAVNETLVPWAAQQTIALKRAHPELMLSDEQQKDGPFITRLPFNRYLIASNFNKETGIIGNLLIDDLGGTKTDEQGNRIEEAEPILRPSSTKKGKEAQDEIVIDLNNLPTEESSQTIKPTPKGVEIIEKKEQKNKQINTLKPDQPPTPIIRRPSGVNQTPSGVARRVERYNPDLVHGLNNSLQPPIIKTPDGKISQQPLKIKDKNNIKPKKPLPWHKAAIRSILETLHLIKKTVEVKDISKLSPPSIEPISDNTVVIPKRDGPRLLLAFNARIANDRLLLINPWQYNMDVKGNIDNITKADTWRMDLGVPLSKLYSQIKSPEELTKEQLAEQVRQKRVLGKDTKRDLTDFYLKFSVPFASLFLVLVGMPLSLKAPRDERMLGLILTYSLVFGYYFLFFIFRAMGYTGYLPPVLAAWGHNIIYSFLAIIIFSTVRK